MPSGTGFTVLQQTTKQQEKCVRLGLPNRKHKHLVTCTFEPSFGELVMFMPMEKPKDKGEVRNCIGIMLGLVDRSDEVVIGTTERVVTVRKVHRMPVGQRGDAAYAKSIRGAVATESS